MSARVWQPDPTPKTDDGRLGFAAPECPHTRLAQARRSRAGLLHHHLGRNPEGTCGKSHRIAVPIPRHDEETTIAKVAADVARMRPTARIHVNHDNPCDRPRSGRTYPPGAEAPLPSRRSRDRP